jgi:hypothetical protein
LASHLVDLRKKLVEAAGVETGTSAASKGFNDLAMLSLANC